MGAIIRYQVLHTMDGADPETQRECWLLVPLDARGEEVRSPDPKRSNRLGPYWDEETARAEAYLLTRTLEAEQRRQLERQDRAYGRRWH